MYLVIILHMYSLIFKNVFAATNFRKWYYIAGVY